MPRSLPFVCLAVAALAAPVLAEDLVGDRPDFTESTVSVPPGGVQIEMGATVDRVDGDETTTIGEMLVRIGLVPRWELRLGVPSYVDAQGGGDGLEDATIGAKVHLADGGGSAPAVALLFTTTVPTGSSDVGEDRLQPDAVLALSWELSDRLELGSNLGYARPAADGEAFDQIFATLALGIDLGGDWGGFVEVFGFSREEPGGDETAYFDAGVTRLVGPDFQLDLRAGTSLAGDGSDLFLGAGAVVRF